MMHKSDQAVVRIIRCLFMYPGSLTGSSPCSGMHFTCIARLLFDRSPTHITFHYTSYLHIAHIFLPLRKELLAHISLSLQDSRSCWKRKNQYRIMNSHDAGKLELPSNNWLCIRLSTRIDLNCHKTVLCNSVRWNSKANFQIDKICNHPWDI